MNQCVGPMNHLALDELIRKNRSHRPSSSQLQLEGKKVMTGPVQRKVQLLKLLHRTDGRVRAALRQLGYRAPRISQLMRDCRQCPAKVSGPAPQPDPPGLQTWKRNNHAPTHRSSATFMMIDNIENTNDAQSIRSYAPNTDCLGK